MAVVVVVVVTMTTTKRAGRHGWPEKNKRGERKTGARAIRHCSAHSDEHIFEAALIQYVGLPCCQATFRLDTFGFTREFAKPSLPTEMIRNHTRPQTSSFVVRRAATKAENEFRAVENGGSCSRPGQPRPIDSEHRARLAPQGAMCSEF